MRGNLAHGRMTKFMPADFKLIEAREPPRIGSRTKHEHFLDRLLRSWHSQLQWENGAGSDEATPLLRQGKPAAAPHGSPLQICASRGGEAPTRSSAEQTRNP
jgi:hypothetical protein